MGDASSLRSSVLWLLLLLSLAIDVPLPAMGDGPSAHDVRLRMKGESSAITASPIPYAQVHLRIEGGDKTIYQGDAFTNGHIVRPVSGAPNPCGFSGASRFYPTPTTALDNTTQLNGFTWDGKYDDNLKEYHITRIKDTKESGGAQWYIYVGYTGSPVQGCHTEVFTGDDILFAFHEANTEIFLMLSGPLLVKTGADFNLTVIDARSNSFVSGASVNRLYPSGDDGIVTMSGIHSPGNYTFQAFKSDTVRSNIHLVQVLAHVEDE